VAKSLDAGKDWPAVVVGGVFQTGLNLMRDLIAHGVNAVGIDHVLDHEGFHSTIGRSIAAPDPDTQPAEWVQFLQGLSRELAGVNRPKPVFICTADAFVTALGRHEQELRGYYTFSPAAAVQAALTSKETQYELAVRHGFPHPRTAYIRARADLLAFIQEAHFPCLLKPLSHREWGSLPSDSPLFNQKVVVAETADQLLNYYALSEPYRPNVIAQEIIQGPDWEKYCYFGVYARDGSLLGNAVVRELRCHPIFFGVPTALKPVIDEEITSLCDRFFRATGYSGICEIEMKRDTRDGKIKLIEVNARFTGAGDCAIYMGVETGWLHYLDLIGRNPAPATAKHFDFHHVMLKPEFIAVPRYLSKGILKWRDVAAVYRGPVKFYDLNPRDWKLFFRTLVLCARYLAGGMVRHFQGK
jgi:predicted ATP-grasp superfamily ATP-dependent carboligase